MLREFGIGVGTLLKGFRMWKTHTKLMSLGLIPAFIAWAVLLAALIPLGFALGPITDWITPFADGWGSPWRETLRIGLGLVIFIAALALAGAVFTALTLTIGDPFYQRIWQGVERSLGGDEPTGKTGLWTTIGEGLRLVVLGILVALLTLVIGLLPLVGGVLASVTGIVLTGRLLARELTGRAFDARGLTPSMRSEMLGAGRARVIGFGVATQLCFLVPFGAIVTMPAAVAGSTLLAHDLLRRATPAPPQPEGSLRAAPTSATRHEATPPADAPSTRAEEGSLRAEAVSLRAASAPSQRHETTP
ncbi:EI24 domain-containing protein, partial [Microbacterium sp. KRD172]|uniref:EI24 domain-containing protein n=1 Tax=Microbacterium sp. KRD172 TaxID=2729727 RepID=UPI0019CFDDEA